MPYIPDGPLIDRLNWMSKTGNDDAGHPFFQAQWVSVTGEAANEIARLPDDVRRLVIAARAVAFEDQGPAALKALDEASEAFADRVQWEEEPASAEQSTTPKEV